MKNKMKQSLAILVAFIMVLTAVGVQMPVTVNAATKIAFSCTKKTVAVDGTYTLTVKGVNDKKAKYAWSSSDKMIATVSKAGVVKGKAEGTATIKCKITMSDKSTKTLSCKVTVKEQKAATSVKISNAKLDENNVHTIVVGEKYDFNRKLSPSKSNDKTYWYIEDEEYAEVDSNGVVTAKKAGTTTLIAKTGIDRVSAEESGNKVVDSVRLKIVPSEEQDEWYTKFLSGELVAKGELSERNFFEGTIDDLAVEALKVHEGEDFEAIYYSICDTNQDKVPELLLHFAVDVETLSSNCGAGAYNCHHYGCIYEADIYYGIMWNGKEAVIIYFDVDEYTFERSQHHEFYENGLIYTYGSSMYGDSSEEIVLMTEKNANGISCSSSWDFETEIRSFRIDYTEETQEVKKLLNVDGIVINNEEFIITASPVTWYDLADWKAPTSNAGSASVQEISKASIGDYVTFGTYEQDNNMQNGAEAIEWQVLDKKDGKVLLLSKYALDSKPYHEDREDVTWETCTLRSWLNKDFYKTAFTSAEQKYIAETYVINDDNPEYGTDGGNNTYDNVFLLSIDEVTTYFDEDPYADDPARMVQVTEYAKAQGGWCNNDKESEYYGNGWWWLRSPGTYGHLAAAVYISGYVRVGRVGNRVDQHTDVVRPALWVEVE